MGFIDNNEVKASHRELLFLIINIVDHGLIGRKHDTGIHIRLFLFAQNRHGYIWQECFIFLMCLIDKSGAVCKEQNVLHPVVAHQYITERNADTGLASTGRKYKKTTTVFLVQPFHNALDGSFLISTVGDILIDEEIAYLCTTSLLNQAFKVVHRMERIDRSVQVAHTVNHHSAESIRVTDNGSYFILALQRVGIQDGLPTTFAYLMSGSLCFNYSKRLAATAEQYIVCIAFSRCTGHVVHFDLNTSLAALYVAFNIENVPSCFYEHIVNEILTSDGFACQTFLRNVWRLGVFHFLLWNTVHNIRLYLWTWCCRQHRTCNSAGNDCCIKSRNALDGSPAIHESCYNIVECAQATECLYSFNGFTAIMTGRVSNLVNQTDIVIQSDIMIDKRISFLLVEHIVEGVTLSNLCVFHLQHILHKPFQGFARTIG